MVDSIFEPMMQSLPKQHLMHTLFGIGKGSGAAFAMMILGLLGGIICLITGRRLKKYRFEEE